MKVFLSDNKIAIKLEYNDDFQKIIDKIKSNLSPYEYNPDLKTWFTEKMNLLIIKEVFQDDNLKIDNNAKNLLKKQEEYLNELNKIKNTEYKKTIENININLFKHQKQAINFLLNQKNAGLFDEQGLGKTISTIATFYILLKKNEIENIIIICPNTLKYNWKKEIELFFSLKSDVLEGSKDQKLKILEKDSNIFITNFESLIVKKTKNKNKSEEFQKKFTKKVNKKTCIIIDEAHRIKSGSSKISKFLRKIGKSVIYKYALTGTPIANKPEDIFYLFMFLDGGKLLGTNYYKFLKQYCILGNAFSDYAIVAYKNLDKLKFLVGLKSLRRLKDEVLDLPEKIFEDRIIETSNKHIKFYKDLKNGILKKIKDNGDVKNIKSCLIRLIQASSNPLLLDEKCNIESNKIKELDNLLEEHIEKSENKVIVWTNFVNNFSYLLERYKKYNPVYINGSVSIEQRQKNVLDFQNIDNIKLIICNPQACKEGITLTASNVAIYLDRTFNLTDYLQSVDRIHRIGQHKTCLVLNLISKETIDEIISKNIFKKHSLAKYVQGDANKIEKQISEEDILKFALQ